MRTVSFLPVALFLVASLVACSSTPKLHKDVELGNESNVMMQCKILCDGTDKPYAFSDNGLQCQCQRPVAPEITQINPVQRYEIVSTGGQSNETISKGVMTQLLNGKTIISGVKGGD